MNIQNCKVIFRCPKTWEALIKTDAPDIRYCNVCDRGVHHCKTESELSEANRQGWCVAVQIEELGSTEEHHENSTTDEDTFVVGKVSLNYFIENDPRGFPKEDPDDSNV